MSDRVRITDVSPRDGLQNEAGVIPTADKIRLIQLLQKTGLDEIEVTSFVSPKWVPQLADAAEVLRALNVQGRTTPPELSVLIPNAKGMESTRPAPVSDAIDKIAVFTAASESFSRRNTNATIAETIERFRPVIADARDSRFRVRGYLSTVIACPFEGPIAPAQAARVALSLAQVGVDEIDLGDTIGAGTPETIAMMLRAVVTQLAAIDRSWADPFRITLHLHDTFGRAAACVQAALDLGVRSFDGSVAGLGGCPYASTSDRRAPGNISTERLVRTVHDAGYTTGVDPAKLEVAAAYAREIVARSRTAHARAPGSAA